MATKIHVEIDRPRIEKPPRREAARLDERTQGSWDLYGRARRSLVGGVASSYQARDPWPIYLSRRRPYAVGRRGGVRSFIFHPTGDRVGSGLSFSTRLITWRSSET